MQKEEKRSFKRIGLHAPIRYQVRGDADFDNSVSDNISEGGVAFNALKFIPPSTALMLEINLPCRVLRPIAKVSWCQPLAHSNRNRMGVEFVEFNCSEKNFLSDYISLKTG